MRIIEGNGGKFNGHLWDCDCYDCKPDTEFTHAMYDAIKKHNDEIRAQICEQSDLYWEAIRADDIDTALIHHEKADTLRKKLK